MKTSAFDSLPPFDESLSRDEILGDLEVVTSGDHCLVRKSGFLALCSLKTGKVNWCVTRNAPDGNREPSSDVFSNLLFWGTKLWIGLNDQVVAEIFYDTPESAKLVARCMRTGHVLWEYVHPRPPHETFNFRPVFCGLGDTHFFEEAQIAVASVAMKKSHWVPSKLLVFNTETKSMDFASSCWHILSPWSGGVVFVSGEKDRRIAFLDLNA